jgi:non-ribosomal peptide synthetase component F
VGQHGGERQPLYEVWFQMEKRRRQTLTLPGLEWIRLGQSPLLDQSAAIKFELSLVLSETDDGIAGEFEYDSNLFEDDTIQQMSVRFKALLEIMFETPETRIVDIGLASQQESQAMAVEYSAALDSTA